MGSLTRDPHVQQRSTAAKYSNETHDSTRPGSSRDGPFGDNEPQTPSPAKFGRRGPECGAANGLLTVQWTTMDSHGRSECQREPARASDGLPGRRSTSYGT